MSAETKKLIYDLAAISKQTKSQLRRKFKDAGGPMLSAVQREAGSFSTRIGPATRLATAFTAKNAGISLITDKNKAPHARPYEHGGQAGSFRHPVYALPDEPRDKWTWVAQVAHPFMLPTAIDELPAMGERVLDILTDVALENGFHKS